MERFSVAGYQCITPSYIIDKMKFRSDMLVNEPYRWPYHQRLQIVMMNFSLVKDQRGNPHPVFH